MIHALTTKNPLSIFVLETGDEIDAVFGENADFFGHRVVGRLEIKTVKGHKFGHFGQSEPAHKLGHFNKSLNDLKLEVANGKYVAAIH